MERKILVIDDSEAMTQLLARFLRNEGYVVSTISDPRLAMRTFRSFRPDLVLLDLNMPHMSGLEVCRKFKEDRAPTPIVIFSVRDDDIDIARGFEAGADDYLIKPFEFPDLLERINRLFQERGKS